MFISLVMDARTSGARLPRQLDALRQAARQCPHRSELLLVDDTSDPRLPVMASRHGARFTDCEPGPLGSRLNAALSLAQGTVMVFPMAPERLPAGWLSELVEGLADQTLEAVVLTRPLPQALRLLNHLLGHQQAGTLAVERSWLERIGGFDTTLDEHALPDLIARLHACHARIHTLAK
ncbi:glycosyltransferase [Halomonas cerina]|uniref:Glycosyltransferase involved in cell wall biosynthesis n=1 Tax=Halomonas cerina TaxID=447424 RepID=A0A839V8I5_9GAMM|nr:glycosyltransferase [Halomonas cerina]MBB3191973.1 glycosyltransferase involved in cell wall biosynthesis [Halomonas cerina]